MYNDDSVLYIEASELKDARFVAERLGNEELVEIALAWTDEEVRAGKNGLKFEDVGTFSVIEFGKREYYELWNEASV